MLVTALYVSLLLPAGEEGMAGLALTSALNLAGVMNWLVRQIADLEVGYVFPQQIIGLGASIYIKVWLFGCWCKVLDTVHSMRPITY